MNPIEMLDKNDPGDDVQLRFHYQHGYGAILAISAICEIYEYVEFWFEQFEDILCKDKEGLFSYYQIKTQNPELGSWKISDKALKDSIKRFTNHEDKFSTVSKEYLFVSNANFLETGEDTKDKQKIANSPINFINNIRNIKKKDWTDHYIVKFDELKEFCKCTEKVLLNTLKKTSFIVGPSKESIDSDISSIHLYSVNKLENKSLKKIHKIRDEILFEIFKSSSNVISDSRKHLFDLAINSPQNPIIQSKKITKNDFMQIIDENSNESDIFRFLPKRTINIDQSKNNKPILIKKLQKAGLERSIDSMERRTLSAEYNLIELSNKDADNFEDVLNQLENIVLTEHSDFELMNTIDDKIDSKKLMTDFIDRMKIISTTEKERVYGHNHDMLIGISGLLTGECKLWWCEKFDLDVDS
ncbi:MAG: DUF4297 domain-containing protein [bacterium]|nr:DUF4297 domain-containing protein [bacterium]